MGLMQATGFPTEQEPLVRQQAPETQGFGEQTEAEPWNVPNEAWQARSVEDVQVAALQQAPLMGDGDWVIERRYGAGKFVLTLLVTRT